MGEEMSKKLVQINVTCNGSTGRIMKQIQKKLLKTIGKHIHFLEGETHQMKTALK